MARPDKSYYEMLGVTPDASKPEIDRAYLAQKTAGTLDAEGLWNLERAYVSLSDPNLKRRYDIETQDRLQKKTASGKSQSFRSEFHVTERDPRAVARRNRLALLASTALLLVILWTQVVPLIAVRVKTYAPGTNLLQIVDGQPFGTVVSYDREHHFPQGKVAAAYLLRLPDDEQRWLPKQEVNALARSAP